MTAPTCRCDRKHIIFNFANLLAAKWLEAEVIPVFTQWENKGLILTTIKQYS